MGQGNALLSNMFYFISTPLCSFGNSYVSTDDLMVSKSAQLVMYSLAILWVESSPQYIEAQNMPASIHHSLAMLNSCRISLANF
jgi:hypothetical protein